MASQSLGTNFETTHLLILDRATVQTFLLCTNFSLFYSDAIAIKIWGVF